MTMTKKRNIIRDKDEMHELKKREALWWEDAMTDFQRISDRIVHIRSVDMKRNEVSEYNELPFFDEKSILSSAENRKILDKLSVLLVVYGADGAEWSISPMGKRFICRESPRRGRFHKHQYVEILYVIEGSFTQILLGEEIRFEQGEFVITDQNCEHADYIEAKDAAVLFLQIRAEYLEQLLKSYDGTDEMKQFLFHALWRQKREQSFLELRRKEEDCNLKFDMEQLLEFLVSEDLVREAGYEKIEQGLMIRLLHHLCQDYTLQLHTDSRESREKAFLYELECYIRTNAATVTVAELEKRFHYHRNYYHLILKKYRGKSFQQYVIEIRMKYAKQLLEQTTLPVKRIAQQVGYENISYFYHLCEKYFSRTPKDIRQEFCDKNYT